MVFKEGFKRILADIPELLRVVKPAEAEFRLMRLIQETSPSELIQLQNEISESIEGFLPKRRKVLSHALSQKIGDYLAGRQVDDQKLRARIECEALRDNFMKDSEVECQKTQTVSVADLCSLANQLEAHFDDLRKRLREHEDLTEDFERASQTIRSSLVRRALGSDVPFEIACDQSLTRLISIQTLKNPEFQDQIGDSPVACAALLDSPNLFKFMPRQYPRTSFIGFLQTVHEFSINQRSELQGETAFDSLNDIDLRLAAQYSDQFELDHFEGPWSLPHIKAFLNNDQAYKTYLVTGLQPRIAEMAFHEVAESTTLRGKAEFVDLNVLAITRNEGLPGEDWANDVEKFDVKSNLWFRSKAGCVGLRGYQLGKVARKPGVRLAAFVFFHSRDTSVQWSFVGFMEENLAPQQECRVAPFFFELPSHFSFSEVSSDIELEPQLLGIIELLEESRPPSSIFDFRNRKPHFKALKHSILHRQRMRHLAEGKYGAEHAMWHYVTNSFFELRSSGATKIQASSMLDEVRTAVEDPWFMFRFATIQGESLISRWIEEALKPINDNWEKIACPKCKNKQISLKPQAISAQGTVLADFSCACGFAQKKVTVITHCRSCSHYPLVIGQEQMCTTCFGLICEWQPDGKATCNTCKCPKAE